jgi:hypothetical protein
VRWASLSCRAPAPDRPHARLQPHLIIEDAPAGAVGLVRVVRAAVAHDGDAKLHRQARRQHCRARACRSGGPRASRTTALKQRAVSWKLRRCPRAATACAPFASFKCERGAGEGWEALEPSPAPARPRTKPSAAPRPRAARRHAADLTNERAPHERLTPWQPNSAHCFGADRPIQK